MLWEMVVLVRCDLRYRSAAVRVEPGARNPHGRPGPPGHRLSPLHRLAPGTPAQGWLATALHIL